MTDIHAKGEPPESSQQIDGGLSEFTWGWMAGVSVEGRKRLGQYMTPGVLRERLLDRCELFGGMRVLDPGVGTGEFLRSVAEREPLAELHGWDVDGALLEVAAANAPEAHLTERSALDVYDGEPFDLVVGNPPYFQFKPSRGIRERFAGVISGRVNIFALFFQAGLEVLRPGGQLAYVVPPSMNTGAYFERLRRHVLERSEIEFLEIHHDQKLFDGAQTPVQLIVLRRADTSFENIGSVGSFSYADGMKRGIATELIDDTDVVKPAQAPIEIQDRGQLGKHSFIRESLGFCRTIFAENPSDLEAAFQGRKSLFELGYEAVTGTIVWNQHRSDLRHEATNGEVPLIWAQNIGNGQLDGFADTGRNHAEPAFDKADMDVARPANAGEARRNHAEPAFSADRANRPHFIATSKPKMIGPAIVANRIVGAVGTGELRCSLVPESMEFVAENHVNVIQPHGEFEPSLDWSELLRRLQSPEIATQIRLVTHNTQLSAAELTHLVAV